MGITAIFKSVFLGREPSVSFLDSTLGEANRDFAGRAEIARDSRQLNRAQQKQQEDWAKIAFEASLPFVAEALGKEEENVTAQESRSWQAEKTHAYEAALEEAFAALSGGSEHTSDIPREAATIAAEQVASESEPEFAEFQERLEERLGSTTPSSLSAAVAPELPALQLDYPTV